MKRNGFQYSLILVASLGLWIVGMPLWAAESGEPGLYCRQEGNLWVGGNGLLEIGIDMAHGTLDRLLDRTSREDYCNQTLVPACRHSFVLRRKTGAAKHSVFL